MNETELKPCPFCGLAESSHKLRKMRDGSWVFSHYCDPDVEKLTICIHVYEDTREEVIEKWNRRATDGKAD